MKICSVKLSLNKFKKKHLQNSKKYRGSWENVIECTGNHYFEYLFWKICSLMPRCHSLRQVTFSFYLSTSKIRHSNIRYVCALTYERSQLPDPFLIEMTNAELEELNPNPLKLGFCKKFKKIYNIYLYVYESPRQEKENSVNRIFPS